MLGVCSNQNYYFYYFCITIMTFITITKSTTTVTMITIILKGAFALFFTINLSTIGKKIV